MFASARVDGYLPGQDASALRGISPTLTTHWEEDEDVFPAHHPCHDSETWQESVTRLQASTFASSLSAGMVAHSLPPSKMRNLSEQARE